MIRAFITSSFLLTLECKEKRTRIENWSSSNNWKRRESSVNRMVHPTLFRFQLMHRYKEAVQVLISRNRERDSGPWNKRSSRLERSSLALHTTMIELEREQVRKGGLPPLFADHLDRVSAVVNHPSLLVLFLDCIFALLLVSHSG